MIEGLWTRTKTSVLNIFLARVQIINKQHKEHTHKIYSVMYLYGYMKYCERNTLIAQGI